MRFFFYGTLRDDAVRSAVLGIDTDRFVVEPALLAGWQCVRLKNRHYPIIVPRPGCRVIGCVSASLPASAVARLDRFEGAEYRRTLVTVLTASRVGLAAQVFVGRWGTPLTSHPWCFEEWVGRHRARYLQSL